MYLLGVYLWWKTVETTRGDTNQKTLSIIRRLNTNVRGKYLTKSNLSSSGTKSMDKELSSKS